MDKRRNLDQLFENARQIPVEASFEETKNNFLESLTAHSNGTSSRKVHFLLTKKGIIMMGILSIIIAVLFLGNDGVNKEKETIETPVVEHIDRKVANDKKIKDSAQVFEPDFWEVAELPLLELEGISFKEAEPFPIQMFKTKKTPTRKVEVKYRFPKLTEKEIADNYKRKKKILKAARKMDSKVYAYIPSGSYSFNGKKVSVQAFMMQRKEVTNLEYKTFLFDLLIQDRKEEFLKAKPKQELWTEVMGSAYQHMQDEYFSDERYEDYPVVNVSREGAEMYCKWLTLEREKVGVKNIPALPDMRLPFRTEWIKAASVEGKLENFAWKESPSPTCFKGNFSTRGYNRIAVTIDKTGEKIPFGDTLAITTAGYILNKGDLTTRVGSYEPNEYGLYDLSGNVAEMVYELVDGKYDRRAMGTVGGGWMSTEDELKFSSDDPYKGESKPHLNIGFRVVMSYLGKNGPASE